LTPTGKIPGFLLNANDLVKVEKMNLQVLKRFFSYKFYSKANQKILTYIVFVAIASIFWFLNKLGSEFTTIIDFPVEYVNLPENKALVNELPQSLHLSVNSFGFDILRYKLSPEPYPLVIDVASFSKNIKSQRVRDFKLPTRYLKESINKQLASELNVLEIMPDTLVFQFSQTVDKRVPIKPNFKLTFANQCLIDGEIQFIPKTVVVTGPSSILDTLQFIYTEAQEFDNMDKPLEQSVDLQEDSKLKLNKRTVVAVIPVAKFTEVSFDVPVIAVNVPDSLRLITFPGITKLSCLVSFNQYNLVQPGDFLVQVDYLEIDNQIGAKLPLELGLAPTGAKNIVFTPQSVEYILERNQ